MLPEQVGPLSQLAALTLKILRLLVELEDPSRVRGPVLVVALQTGLLVELGILPDVLDVDDWFGSYGRA